MTSTAIFLFVLLYQEVLVFFMCGYIENISWLYMSTSCPWLSELLLVSYSSYNSSLSLFSFNIVTIRHINIEYRQIWRLRQTFTSVSQRSRYTADKYIKTTENNQIFYIEINKTIVSLIFSYQSEYIVWYYIIAITFIHNDENQKQHYTRQNLKLALRV